LLTAEADSLAAGRIPVFGGGMRIELGGDLTQETLLAGQIALGRVGEPDDAGGMVASLLSDENRWTNAQNIEIGGGYIIRGGSHARSHLPCG
jgi:NAD(P)-dependent dehydrogenase (short-subunit alcohol dehydrogenase family)